MRRIADFDIDLELEIERVAAGDLQVGDVGAVLANDIGKCSKRPRSVLQPDNDACHRKRADMFLPTNIDPIGHTVLVAVQDLAIDRVDHDAFAWDHQANDAVARYGMTAGTQAIADTLGQTGDGDA